MSGLVVYDSQYGNTRKIAEAISHGFADHDHCKTIYVDNIHQEDLEGISYLVVGSPTQGFTATAKIKNWLDSLAGNSLKGIQAAAFDTRFTQEKIAEVRILSLLVSIFGYGAQPIGRRLVRKGAELVLEPIGFYVRDTEGPLLDQEIQRAEDWAHRLGTEIR